jgi:hypothetical protein
LSGQEGLVRGDRIIKGKGHQGDVDGVEHDLNAHQDGDGVSLGQGAVESNAEKHRAEYQEMVECEHDVRLSPLYR